MRRLKLTKKEICFDEPKMVRCGAIISGDDYIYKY